MWQVFCKPIDPRSVLAKASGTIRICGAELVMTVADVEIDSHVGGVEGKLRKGQGGTTWKPNVADHKLAEVLVAEEALVVLVSELATDKSECNELDALFHGRGEVLIMEWLLPELLGQELVDGVANLSRQSLEETVSALR